MNEERIKRAAARASETWSRDGVGVLTGCIEGAIREQVRLAVDGVEARLRDAKSGYAAALDEARKALSERDEARKVATELRDLCRAEGMEQYPEDEPFTLPWEIGR